MTKTVFLLCSGFECVCTSPYEPDGARTYEDHYDRCTTEVCVDGSRCHNTGTCVASGDGSASCDCSSGFTGSP